MKEHLMLWGGGFVLFLVIILFIDAGSAWRVW